MPTINHMAGREPVTIVEIQQPLCTNTFGASPCTATGEKCFNTRNSCKDTDNFALGDPLSLYFTTGTLGGRLDTEYLFTSDSEIITTSASEPIEISARTTPRYLFPCLASVSTSPTKINLASSNQNAQGLGNRAICTIKFKDFAHTDRVVDPYLSSRAYDPVAKGSFWSKWAVRNKYRQNVVIKIYEGYMGQSLTDMMTRTYFLQSFTGPDANGNVTIQGKDILAKLEERKAQAPKASSGELFVAINNSQTSFEVAGAIVSDYPANGTIRINDELMTYTALAISTNGITFSGITRGTDGTAADTHGVEDAVQECLRFDSETVDVAATKLLRDYGLVSASYLDDWSEEVNNYLSPYRVNSIITEPTSVTQLVSELQTQMLFYLWWDERLAKVRLRAIRGIDDEPPILTESDNLLADSFSFVEKPKERVSRIIIHFGMKSYVGSPTDVSNYNFTFVNADLESETENLFGEPSTKTVFARFLDEKTLAANTARKIIQRFVDNPRTAKFKLDAKDREYWVGDTVSILHHLDVDQFGDEISTNWTIISAEENMSDGTITYEADDTTLYGRIHYIMAAQSGDYNPIAGNPFRNAYIGDAQGLLSDGTEAGKIS